MVQLIEAKTNIWSNLKTTKSQRSDYPVKSKFDRSIHMRTSDMFAWEGALPLCHQMLFYYNMQHFIYISQLQSDTSKI